LNFEVWIAGERVLDRREMKNKYLEFIKNMTLASTVSILTGVLTSRFAGEFVDNGKIIGTIATLTQYTAWFGAFLPLHASDNRELYTNPDGRFNTRKFANDNLKFGGSFLLLDGAYILTRPLVQDYLIRNGFDAGNSSWVADLFYIPVYTIASIGIAKLTGIIKSKNITLEESISN